MFKSNLHNQRRRNAVVIRPGSKLQFFDRYGKFSSDLQVLKILISTYIFPK